MELKHYFEILLRRWWIVLATILLALGAAWYLTAQQPWVYEADATFVVRPRLVDAGDAVKAIDTLIRGGEINETFAGIATSDAIVDQAKATLGKDVVKRSETSVRADVVAGTNILRLTVSGRDPLVVKEYTDEIAIELVAYIEGLEDVFTLSPLDGANLPNNPAGPRKSLSIVLAGILGTMAGMLLAATVEYLSDPDPGATAFNIIDPETLAYNEQYFRRRFDQEISRARNTDEPFVLAAIQQLHYDAISQLTLGDMRFLADIILELARPEDVLAYVGNSMFILLLPAMTEAEAEPKIAEWRDKHFLPFDGSESIASAEVSIGICEYGGREHDPIPIGIGTA